MRCLPSKDDGSLRLYCPPDTKVVRAIRGLDSEVSSVISVTPNNGGFGHVWVACGSSVSCGRFSESHSSWMYVILNERLQVKLFNLDIPQLVQSNANALAVINVGENEGEANEACALDVSSAFSEKLTFRYLLVRTRRLSHSPWIVGLWAWWI
jgi:hypothetical protein